MRSFGIKLMLSYGPPITNCCTLCATTKEIKERVKLTKEIFHEIFQCIVDESSGNILKSHGVIFSESIEKVPSSVEVDFSIMGCY